MANSVLPALAQLPAILGGAGRGTSGDTRPSHVCVDSRESRDGSLFFALPGASSDGHRFVGAAARAGACAAVVRADTAPDGSDWPVPVVVVKDALEALHQLAAWYVRERLASTRRIGITGSNGKTTTKEMTAAVLSQRYRVYASPGNLNSETGLPLSVLSTPPAAEVAVYEMAMSNPGEMAPLARIVRPDIAAITTIGTAHIGQLGSREAIAREKKAITAAFDGSQTLIVPEDDDFRDMLGRDVIGSVRDFGPAVQSAELQALPGAVRVTIDGDSVEVPLPGVHSGRNALLSLRIGELLGVETSKGMLALAAVSVPDGRGQRLRVAGLTIVNDAYNANPGSVRAALQAVDTEENLVVVLGDMYELGAYEDEGHRVVLSAALQGSARLVCLVGSCFGRVLASMPEAAAAVRDGRVIHAADAESAAGALRPLLEPGDTVLLKASRAVALEQLIPLIGTGEGARA